MAKTLVYQRWKNMKSRCNNPSNNRFYIYGARGIKVCKQWDQFENFLKDMGNITNPKLSLDRIDNDKGYCKANCRWVLINGQANNTSRTKYFSYKNKKVTIRQISNMCGLKYKTVSYRINNGWSIKQILKTPLGCRK